METINVGIFHQIILKINKNFQIFADLTTKLKVNNLQINNLKNLK